MEEIKVPMCNTAAMWRETGGMAGGSKWRERCTLERDSERASPVLAMPEWD